VVVFLRTCPHAAADLAMGSLRGSELTCPEHNVPFDLRTGESPCRSLATLKQRPCVEHDGVVEVSLGG
jgi:nitrite reductase/ring-hydroxylating ferredoxin subunit